MLPWSRSMLCDSFNLVTVIQRNGWGGVGWGKNESFSFLCLSSAIEIDFLQKKKKKKKKEEKKKIVKDELMSDIPLLIFFPHKLEFGEM